VAQTARSCHRRHAPPPPPLPLLPSDEFSGGGGGGTSSTDAPHGSGAGGDAAGPPRARLFTLDFGFAAGVFQLPGSARDQFFQIQNVTLAGLPQGLAPQERAWAAQLLASSGGRRRRLAAAAHGHAHGHAHGRGPARRLLQIDRQTPPGIWTLLLWPIRKCVAGRGVPCMAGSGAREGGGGVAVLQRARSTWRMAQWRRPCARPPPAHGRLPPRTPPRTHRAGT
jgi:hypothetical protein